MVGTCVLCLHSGGRSCSGARHGRCTLLVAPWRFPVRSTSVDSEFAALDACRCALRREPPRWGRRWVPTCPSGRCGSDLREGSSWWGDRRLPSGSSTVEDRLRVRFGVRSQEDCPRLRQVLVPPPLCSVLWGLADPRAPFAGLPCSATCLGMAATTKPALVMCHFRRTSLIWVRRPS